MKKLLLKSIIGASVVFCAVFGATSQAFAQGVYVEGYSASSEPYITGGSFIEGYSASSEPYITGGSFTEGYSASSEPYITGGSYTEGYSVSSEPYITGGSFTEGYSASSEPYITGGSYTPSYSEPYITGGYYDAGYAEPYVTGGYYDSGASYTTPSWTGYNYTAPTYTYPTYTYSTYTYPTPTPVPAPAPTVYTCTYSTNDANVRSYNNNYPTCTKVCTNGTTVAANAQCPSINTTQQCIRTQIYEPNVARYNNDYPACTKTCTNGTTVAAGASCPNIVNPQVCSDGLPPVNGSCVRTNIIPTTNNTICSDGLPPVNGTCVRINTIPTVTQTICSDGTYPVNGSCTHVITTPSVTYQSCWDGSRIPLYSVCPAQYKTCANGTSVPVNQQCYYGNTYVPYTPPTTIKFNNVITSVATEITLASARCNGIGLIASNAPSTGWFEYGETPNLGRETAKANIGSSATAPFSNVLANLKPTTTYYCRAVMQNSFGTVKGEIVAFTTKSKAVSYVKPITKTTIKTTTKTVAKKNEIVCVDGSVAAVGSKTAVDLINAGGKLVSLQIEKSSGNLAAGTSVIYKLTLKNLSDEKLSGMTVKVTIPKEIALTNASAGSYDPMMHVLTVINVPVDAYGEAVINWTGTVAKDAPVGTSMVTTAYTRYAVPSSNVEDEVTAYVVGSVVPGNDAATTTGAKKVVGASTAGGFLPNSLVEWLALIAILFIIFILGRSLYTSYASDRKTTH